MQNRFAVRFIGRLRDECLNEHLLSTLKDARRILWCEAAWNSDPVFWVIGVEN
jgi:hypothetical protein